MTRVCTHIAILLLLALPVVPACAAEPLSVTETVSASITFRTDASTTQWHGTLGLARTAAQRALGFMYRQQIPADEGLLFVYAEPQPLLFWMQHTYVPLMALSYDSNCHLVRNQQLRPHSLRSIALGMGRFVVEIPADAAPRSLQDARLFIPDAVSHGLPACFTAPAGTQTH